MADNMVIGIIGYGDMGRLYARKFAGAKLKVNVCDIPEKYESILSETKDPNIVVCRDGFAVSRSSDFIIYSVEAANINKVVSLYGPATKVGAIVAGQTSVKEPEICAFDQHLPADAHIMSIHSLHGPSIDTEGQALVIMRHRISDDMYAKAQRVLWESLHSQHVLLNSYLEHDTITADTQAVTHLAFLSMGSAWKHMNSYPWLNTQYVGGIENVKVLMALRIYSNKWHVYAGLAIFNPSAKRQIRQYAASVTDLLKLMLLEKKDELAIRLQKAGDFVFGDSKSKILLSDEALQEFSLGGVPVTEQKPNSHLSLLAMIDSWAVLKIKPYEHIICQTPLYRLWLGIVEYLFKTKSMFEASIHAAAYNKDIRADDLEFCVSVREWATLILDSSLDGYKNRFVGTSDFFADRLVDGNKLSARMIQKLILNPPKQ